MSVKIIMFENKRRGIFPFLFRPMHSYGGGGVGARSEYIISADFIQDREAGGGSGSHVTV